MSDLTVLDMARSEIVGMRADFERLLGGAVQVERFERAVLTAIATAPQLLELPKDTLLDACRKAASDRLMPDGKEGAIIPRWNEKSRRMEAAWQPMVRGIVKIAKLYAGVQSVICELVYEGEPFRVLQGDIQRIDHERKVECVAPGKEIACYAIFVYGAEPHQREREIMSRAQIEAIRERSPGGAKGKGPWATDWGEMARKTLIHRLGKRMATKDEAGESLFRQVVERIEEEYDFGERRGEDRAPAQQPQQPASSPPQTQTSGPAGRFHAAAQNARDVDPATGEVAGAAKQGGDAPADPLFVPLSIAADGKPDWAPWGLAMKAHLAECKSGAEIKALNEKNGKALSLMRERNEKAWLRWMDSCTDRAARIEDEARPPAPADDTTSFGREAA